MKEENTQLKSAMTSGALMGLVLVLFTVILYVIGVATMQKYNWISNVIFIGGIFMGQKVYRDSILNGIISYGKALGTGVLIALFAGFLVGLFSFILYKYIDPELMDKQIAFLEDSYIDAGLSDDQIAASIQMSKWFFTPIGSALGSSFGFAFFGFIFSLITSIFIKREGDGFDAAMKDIKE